MLGLATGIKSLLLQLVEGHSKEKNETQLNQVPHSMAINSLIYPMFILTQLER